MYLISIEILAIFVFMQTVVLFNMPFFIVSQRKKKKKKFPKFIFKLAGLGNFVLILLLLGLFNRAVGEERGGGIYRNPILLGLNTVFFHISMYKY